jgi:hypothetical protein
VVVVLIDSDCPAVVMSSTDDGCTDGVCEHSPATDAYWMSVEESVGEELAFQLHHTPVNEDCDDGLFWTVNTCSAGTCTTNNYCFSW